MRVTVTRVQAGTQPVVVGSATATVDVRADVIGINPDSEALKRGDQQIFTVTGPPGLGAGATLSYRWSTTGDFGSLNRGSTSFQSSSNTATYTATSATRGWDDVAVEVLATANGQTITLGTDRATVTIQRGPFAVQPARVTTKIDSVVRFVARPFGDVPPNGKYTWQFGDNSPALIVPGDSLASHVYRSAGTYHPSVERQDAQGRRVAIAGAVVEVDVVPLDPVWRITSLALVSTTGQVPADSENRPGVPALSKYFTTRRSLADIAAGREPAHIHAIDGFTSLPDCFDFNFNQNRTEQIRWQHGSGSNCRTRVPTGAALIACWGTTPATRLGTTGKDVRSISGSTWTSCSPWTLREKAMPPGTIPTPTLPPSRATSKRGASRVDDMPNGWGVAAPGSPPA